MSRLQPPGTTTRIEAERALVLAPHYDDEVLGCGGLAAQLTRGGTRVDVLFLSDSAGTAAVGEDAAAHSASRRREAAEAARVLGIAEVADLALPDGHLAHHLEAAASGIAREIAARRPSLVLVPSPLEATADHRAAFAALHRALAPVRGQDPLERISILAYEVNRPLYPDVLVDVTAELPCLEAAMACYSSQEALHRYLAARQGLLRWRCLSLPVEVEAAEAYNTLTLDDFRTRSLSQVIAHLGGEAERFEVADGPLVSVVVRTKDRPELLAEALASIATSTYRRLEVVLVNDGGRSPSSPAEFPFPLRRVEHASSQGRARAAQAGVEAAAGDYVGFLDDDDLLAPEHLETLVGMVAGAGVRVAYTDAAVGVYELTSGGWRCVERRLPYSRDFDADLLRLDNYIPFHTLLVERALFSEAGPFDATLEFFEDWEWLIRLSQRATFHHLGRVTCEYRHFRGAGHHILGAASSTRADFTAVKARVLAKHVSSLPPERLAGVIERLRAEAVALGESRDAERKEGVRLEAERRRLERALADATPWSHRYHELEGHFHRLHGEAESLRGETLRLTQALERQTAELSRLFGEEARLRTDLAAQVELVGRLYAEIERLNARIRAMEGTRAWRTHQWWQRRTGRGEGR